MAPGANYQLSEVVAKAAKNRAYNDAVARARWESLPVAGPPFPAKSCRMRSQRSVQPGATLFPFWPCMEYLVVILRWLQSSQGSAAVEHEETTLEPIPITSLTIYSSQRHWRRCTSDCDHTISGKRTCQTIAKPRCLRLCPWGVKVSPAIR
jgi:hypothetical protein